MRLTLRVKEERYPTGRHRYADSWTTPLSWYIHGTFLNSASVDETGSYYVVVTENGRTGDGCKAASLGKVLGSFLFSGHRNDNPRLPLGVLPDKLVMTSSGDTVFASKLEGVSRSDLAGAGLAVCERVENGFCSGRIQFCATVSKDSYSAMEVPSTNSDDVKLYDVNLVDVNLHDNHRNNQFLF